MTPPPVLFSDKKNGEPDTVFGKKGVEVLHPPPYGGKSALFLGGEVIRLP
jgi:hypothetical protein